jgi:hypothetical protein
MDSKQFRETMALLFTTYRQKIDKALSDSYYLFLKEYSVKEFREAVVKIVKAEKFFPSVAMIVDYINGEECTEIEMKADIMNAITSYGYYSDPKFKYKISQAVADDIGWVAMCRMSVEDLNSQIHFRYKTVLEDWKDCKRTGREFIVSPIKGYFGESSRSGSTKQISFEDTINKIGEKDNVGS